MSLKDVGKARVITDMVQRVRAYSECEHGKDAFCAMVVDKSSLRVLSSFCKVYDMIEDGVTVVEMLEKGRQALPELDVVYFVAPTQEVVKLLCDDFANERRPKYRNVHIFFTSEAHGASTDILTQIASEPNLLARLKSLVEFNLDFVAYEQRIFHLDMPLTIVEMFPPTDLSPLEVVAGKLATVFASLNQLPSIRFHQNKSRMNEQLATLMHQKLAKYSDSLSRGRTTLIIVDRSIDVGGVLVHEYTYQAIAYDLLEIPVCMVPEETSDAGGDGAGGYGGASNLAKKSRQIEDTFEYNVTNNAGQQEDKTAVLGEYDDVWCKYRHQHITVVNKCITDEVSRFAKQNAAAQMNKSGKMSNEETIAAIRSLPNYQEVLSKYWVHVTMSELCFKELQAQSLMRVGTVEQDLVSGVDREGKEISTSKVLQQLGVLLSDLSVSTQTKMRLLLLYFTSVENVREENMKKMIDTAGLSLESRKILDAFMTLKLDETQIAMEQLDQDDEAKKSKKKEQTKHTHRMANDPNRLQFYKRRAKTAEFELSRYQPVLREIMEQAATDKLHAGNYPYVMEPDRRRAGRGMEGAAEAEGMNLRARNLDWDWSGVEVNDTPEKNQTTADLDPNKRRIVVFVIGGITMAEMRSAYEVMRATGVEIYLGGTAILTFNNLVAALRKNGASSV